MNKRKRTAAGCEETFPGSDYTDDEREFIIAMDRFRHKSKRRFPTCRDVLAVIQSLGYSKGTGDQGSGIRQEPTSS